MTHVSQCQISLRAEHSLLSRTDHKHFILIFSNHYSSLILHILHVDNICIHRPINNTNTLAAWKGTHIAKLTTLHQHPNELHKSQACDSRPKGNAARMNTKQEIMKQISFKRVDDDRTKKLIGVLILNTVNL
jgi:hypothetical protein